MNITDALLEQAAPEAAERWLSTLPDREHCGHPFSPAFEEKMRPLLRRRKRRLWKRIVLLAAVVALLGTAVHANQAQDYPVRATARDGMLVCTARPQEELVPQPFHRITPGWLPEGLTLWSEHAPTGENAYSSLTYWGEDGQSLHLRQWMGREYSETLMGEYRWEDVTIHGSRGILIASVEDSPSYALLWTEGPYVLHLSIGGGLDRETVLKIAENLEW